jgi:RimJ/RimL family protein N-acetyltransferase
MQISPAPLENAFVRLEPLTPGHLSAWKAACAADADFWNRLSPNRMLEADFDANAERMLKSQADGASQTWMIFRGDALAGTSSFLAIDRANATLEIGSTYYHPDFRGGPVNPSAKHLLLGHAFACGARRVQFNVDALNLRSRAAVGKLGAKEEGVRRSDRVTWTGRVRDTVVFSILAAEWPAVRDQLDARLAAFPV